MNTSREMTVQLRLERRDFCLDVDLRLPGQGISVLFGPSGSGKSTLLRCVAGLERAARGTLRVAGDVWLDGSRSLPTHRRAVGYVFQEASLFAHLDVAGNLDYGRRRSAGASRSLDSIVELLDIGALLRRWPGTLSGGERQRVCIAQALAGNPQVLLMDEPLAALDQARKRELLPYLDRLHEHAAIPVLYVTHDPAEAIHLGDHLVLLQHGKALASGPLATVLAAHGAAITPDDALGTVLDGVVGARDDAWHLLRVDLPGAVLWVPDNGLVTGHQVRVRVLARDVSLVRQRPEQSSILNLLPGQVLAIEDDAHPGLLNVQLHVGDATWLARVTRRSAALLELTPGLDLWLQVKSVALLE
ncbi:MAG: molybdenum ABC transporter ATP-binding protein [Gammaproteobacteria bacterium HGW-Gammaproteobacteria-4]|jgi:molybdate transport system ATP-binding protein|nr:MAG: molybdenum ABC transporter ATP-binding protein [Gammaproteobacteria bacterium HGW-Gammaproteobacteria-4]